MNVHYIFFFSVVFLFFSDPDRGWQRSESDIPDSVNRQGLRPWIQKVNVFPRGGARMHDARGGKGGAHSSPERGKGIGQTENNVVVLKDVGDKHVQVSFQGCFFPVEPPLRLYLIVNIILRITVYIND
jgi:hypothetical protein